MRPTVFLPKTGVSASPCLRVVAALVLFLTACVEPGPNATLVTLPPEARELLGTDDGMQAAIFFGGELMGATDGCGCFGTPLAGGMAYRFAYSEGFRAEYPDVATVQVDAGNSLVMPTDDQGTELKDLVAKNEAMLTAFERLGFDVVNITSHDIEAVATFLADQKKGRPLVSKMVSANLVPVREGAGRPNPYVVVELKSNRLSTPIRVAFTGVTERTAAAATAGYEVMRPIQAISMVVEAARKEVDLVVVLAFLDKEAAAEIIEHIGDKIDHMIVAHPTVRDLEPEGKVSYGRYKAMHLGELRLKFAEKRLASAATRYVKMYEPLPRHELADQLAKDAKEAIKGAQLERFEGK